MDGVIVNVQWISCDRGGSDDLIGKEDQIMVGVCPEEGVYNVIRMRKADACLVGVLDSSHKLRQKAQWLGNSMRRQDCLMSVSCVVCMISYHLSEHDEDVLVELPNMCRLQWQECKAI